MNVVWTLKRRGVLTGYILVEERKKKSVLEIDDTRPRQSVKYNTDYKNEVLKSSVYEKNNLTWVYKSKSLKKD